MAAFAPSLPSYGPTWSQLSAPASPVTTPLLFQVFAERVLTTLSRSIALDLHFLAWLIPTTPTLSLLHQSHLSITLFLWIWAYDSRLALRHHAETPFGDP